MRAQYENLKQTCVHIEHWKLQTCVHAQCCSTNVHSFPLTLRSLTKSWSATPRSLLSTKPPLTNDDFFRQPGKCQHPNTKKEIYLSQNKICWRIDLSCCCSTGILSQRQFITQIVFLPLNSVRKWTNENLYQEQHQKTNKSPPDPTHQYPTDLKCSKGPKTNNNCLTQLASCISKHEVIEMFLLRP